MHFFSFKFAYHSWTGSQNASRFGGGGLAAQLGTTANGKLLMLFALLLAR